MNRSKDEFIAKWRSHVAGKLALGTSAFRVRLKASLTSGAISDTDALGEVLANIGQEVDVLLAKLYDDLKPREEAKTTNSVKAPAPLVGANGKENTCKAN